MTSRSMTNEEGRAVETRYFTFSIKGINEGKVVTGPNEPMKIGSTSIYISNDDGTPADLAIVYKFTLPKDTRGGNYSSDLTYTLSEI